MQNQIFSGYSSTANSRGRRSDINNHSLAKGNPSRGASGYSSSPGFGGGFGGLDSIFQNIIGIIQDVLAKIGNKPNKDNTTEYRSIDGSGNNAANPDWGAAETSMNRMTFKDATREPGGTTEAGLPSAREVSNAVSAQTGSTANSKGLSDLFWVWGQFLDHDLTLVHADSGEYADIGVPTGDAYFDPNGTGTSTIGFTRSSYTLGANGQAEQTNSITAYIDGSNVYGSDQATADSLRTFSGGQMILSEGGYLPKGADGSYQAGDIRANENPALTSMHTLWVREHNRIAEELAGKHPKWSDETLYQEARKQVVAEIQAITYNEYLPNLLGENALSDYKKYDRSVDAGINNEFAAAAYRYGHTMLSPNLLRLDENGQEIPEGNLSLRDAFFQPGAVSEAGIDPILRGAAAQTAQAFDPMVVDDVRNFLFGQPGMGGFDLAALNIQRGRDHGLPGYNDVRESLGLSRIDSFDDPIWQGDFGQKLAQVYDSPDDVDLWVGGLAENRAGDSLAGETLTTILSQQFTALRDGDRFWYENQYSGKDLKALNNLTLSDVIKRNTDIVNIQDNVMVASNVQNQQPVQGSAQAGSMAPMSMAAPTMRTMNAQVPRSAPPVSMPIDTQQLQNLLDALHKGFLG